jgi:tetratricopeptide (TPR) repeat protein
MRDAAQVSPKKQRTPSLDLFVSYAGPDRAWAEWVAWHLAAAGYSIELDVWDWAAGDNVVLRMSDALDRAVRVLALWSPSYFEPGRFTTEEWTASVAQRPDETGQRRLVPIRVAEVTPPSVLKPLLFRDVFGVDEDRAKAILLEAVRGPRDARGLPEFPGTAKRRPKRTAAPRLPGVLPAVWNVPLRNAAFTGRVAPLVQIRQQLCRENTAVVQALHGLGGIGKTTLAIEYAHRFAGSYELVWWINAERTTLIGEQFATLGVQAGWITGAAPTANPTTWVLQRLRAEPGWLLIFDNAEDRSDLLPWLPQGAGHVLITSRNPGWEQAALPMALPEFTRAESISLLHSSLPDLTDANADRLADRLGDLPLAVAQAAQTLADTGLSVADYLVLLDEQTVEILSDGIVSGYQIPLAAVVRTSMQRLVDRDPAAAELMQLCAFLAPEPIPLNLFTEAPPGTLPAPLAETAASMLALARSMRSIRSLGLAKIGEGTVQLHRLTQAVIRNSAGPAQELIRRQLESTMTATHLDDGRDPKIWPRWAELLPHILALEPASSNNVNFRQIACHASSFLLSRGDAKDARDFANRLYIGWQQRLGPDDHQTLFAALNLANADRDLGRFDDALRLVEQVHERRRSLLGDNHPDTLVSAGCLATAFNLIGRRDEALVLEQDTYTRSREVLGDDHFETLITKSNLATTLCAVGRFTEARSLAQDGYDQARRLLGDDHPATLSAARVLTDALDNLGLHDEALTLNQFNYDRTRQVLGDNHLDTVNSAASLARTFLFLGRHGDALSLAERAYGQARGILGNRHPDTLEIARSVAEALRLIGRKYDAHQMMDLIERYTRQSNHPSTSRKE